jgi:hypothetical protein
MLSVLGHDWEQHRLIIWGSRMPLLASNRHHSILGPPSGKLEHIVVVPRADLRVLPLAAFGPGSVPCGRVGRPPSAAMP